LTSYSKTRLFWIKQHRNNYIEKTESTTNIEMSKFLVNKYGHNLKGCQTFCELGLGSGRNLFYFHKKFPEWSYMGNDINPNTYGDIKNKYPGLLDIASIENIDTLKYLRKPDLNMDITLTHGHLMHLPNDIINEVCDLIAKKTNMYLLLYEAFLNNEGIGLIQRLRYKRYRFDRDYENMFPGFILKDKHISHHLTKKWIRMGLYFFKKK